MAQPATPPGGLPPPVPPPVGPFPPPGYAPYYPPPQKNRTVLIVVVVVVVLLVVTFVIAAVLYVLVSGLITGPGPGPNPPVLIFSSVAVVTEVNGTVARFSILASQNPAPVSEFRERLSVDGLQGSTVPVAPSASIQVGATTYTVTWTDAQSDGLVSISDEFTVSTTGGLAAGHDFLFTLLWNRGTASSSWTASWST